MYWDIKPGYHINLQIIIYNCKVKSQVHTSLNGLSNGSPGQRLCPQTHNDFSDFKCIVEQTDFQGTYFKIETAKDSSVTI